MGGVAIYKKRAGLNWSAKLPNNKAVLFGDSHVAGSGGAGANSHYLNNAAQKGWNKDGCVNWANFLLGQALDIVALEGVGGEDSTGILARVGNVVQHDPGYVFIFSGTNDTVAATAIANMQSMVDVFEQNEIISVIVGPFPRYFASINQATLQVQHDIRKGYALIAKDTPSVIYVDPFDDLIDSSTATKLAQGEMLPANTTDGTHIKDAGARLIGQRIHDALLDTGISKVGITNGQWDGTNGDNDSLLLNGHFFGTTGTTVAPVSGDLADDWKMTEKSNASQTCVCSKVARTDGVAGFWQQFVIDASTTHAEYMQMEQINSATSYDLTTRFAEGTPVIAECEIEIEVTSGTLDYLRLGMTQYTSGWSALMTTDIFSGTATSSDFLIDSTTTGVLRTIPTTVQVGSKKTAVVLDIGPSAAGNITVRVGRIAIREVDAVPVINVS